MALDLEALRAFVKVAKLGSFTRPGAHLSLSKAQRIAPHLEGGAIA